MARWLLTIVVAPLAVAGLDLGKVLPDGHQLDAQAGGGRRQGVEVAQRGDVGRLVEHDEQGWIERAPAGCRPPADGRHHLVDQGARRGAGAAAGRGSGAQMYSVLAAAIEELLGCDLERSAEAATTGSA